MSGQGREAVAAALALVLLSATLLLLLRGPAVGTEGAENSLAVARALEQRLVRSIARLTPSVVAIRPAKEGRRALGSGPVAPSRSGGSGVIIRTEGFILTNDHVTFGRKRVMVTFSDGVHAPGVVWSRDRIADLALIKVGRKGLKAVTLGDSAKLRPGEPVIALGNALGLAVASGEPAATFGVISGTRRFQGGKRVYGDAIQFDAAVNPGNSGGGLFSLDGTLLGITGRISVRGRSSRNVGVGFAVSARQITIVLDEMLAGRDIRHGFLGLKFRPDDGGPGVSIAGIVPNSPAARAGLRKADLLLSIDGVVLDHALRLQNLLSVLPAGRKLVIRYRRGIEERELELKLDPRREGR